MGKDELEKLYELLQNLEENKCQRPSFGEVMKELELNQWPDKGVYFFFNYGLDSVIGDAFPRIVRVGTHDIKKKDSKATLRSRLRQHYGTTTTGGGNHRESSFRWDVGNAFIQKNQYIQFPQWEKRKNISSQERIGEEELEREVSGYIRKLGVIVLNVPCKNDRICIERNAIMLLSNEQLQIHARKIDTLFEKSTKEKIRKYQLWNDEFVGEKGHYDKDFFKILEKAVDDSKEYKAWKINANGR